MRTEFTRKEHPVSIQSNVLTKRRAGVAALIAAIMALVVAVAVGSSSASATPGGKKGKPTPSPTVSVSQSPSPTPTVTPTVTPTDDPTPVPLSCVITSGYVVVSYDLGTIYVGAVVSDGLDLDGNVNVLASFGSGTRTKFPVTMLPAGVLVSLRMVTVDGVTVASCIVNTGYSDPYN